MAGQPDKQRTVRLTVDVSLEDHAALTQLTVAAANDLGVVRVTRQEILCLLLRRLLDDEVLQRHVMATIKNNRRSQ